MRRGKKPLSNVVGIDDAAFDRAHRGDVPVVGTVFAGLRFDGVMIGKVRRDGANATSKLASLVLGSKFREHLQLLMLNGIALGGFNVVDIHGLHEQLGLPILVVCRRQPDFDAIREALLTRVPGGRRKWALIERLGAMEPAGKVFVQRAGLDLDVARATVERFAVHGHVPEPLRVAHLIGGAVADGESRGQA